MSVFSRNSSIKSKLVVVITGHTAALLALTLTLLLLYDYSSSRESYAQKIETLSEVILDNSTAALIFNEPRAAGQTLAALRADPRIVQAMIVKADGNEFATYNRRGYEQSIRGAELLAESAKYLAPNQTRSSSVFASNALTVFVPALADNENFGILVLRADLVELQERQKRNLLIFFAAMLIMALTAVLSSSYLQGVISRPVTNLLSLMRRVSRDRDYGVRAEPGSGDYREIGELVHGFNDMLTQIQSRDAKLANLIIDLRDAKVAAEAANIAKSQFLAVMSHELRTPLNAINGYAELVAEELDGSTYQTATRDLTKISTAASHLLSIIEDILDFSKIDGGKLTLRCEDFYLPDAVNEVVTVIQPLVTKNNNEFVVEIADNIATIKNDIVRVKQILYNLLSNAAKFTTNGRIVLSVSKSESTAHEEKNLKISVSDTGPSISPEYIDQLFTPFSQADDTSARRYGGTGLGLSITQRLVTMMGGEISVSSNVGIGSTFRVDIPLTATNCVNPREHLANNK